jgi:hypothetical protein
VANWRSELSEAVQSVGALYEPDHLAYMAVTSKPELPIRDALAWRLHQQVGAEYLVAREWHRHDLVALDSNEEPVMVLEAKAYITANHAHGMRDADVTALDADLTKLAAYPANTFQLVVNVHVGADVPNTRFSGVKYAGEMNRSAQRLGGSDQVLDSARRVLERHLTRAPGAQVERTTIDAGTIWDLPVVVDLYLLALGDAGS